MSLLKNSQKILGMNARNLRYIRVANKKKAVKIANNKLLSKKILANNNLPVADLFGIIRNREELHNFNWQSLPNSFVLKPNLGLGGEGIIVVFGKKKEGLWIASGDKLVSIKDLILHVSNILDGNFSMSNIPDTAFFEDRLKVHPEFKKISYQGMPDIRIIVFNNVPVMAMLRLPTKESDGKANLHQGGVGVGIDLTTGTTTYAAQHEKSIDIHPDTLVPLSGFAIPEWDNILKIAIETNIATGLGYSGVDIVIDRDKGPMILEINGHPGLGIQNANRAYLKERLNRVADLNIDSVQKGIKVAKELFAQEIPQATTLILNDEKTILGFIELITLQLPNQTKQEIRAKIDTGIASTTINRDTAIKLGFKNVIDKFDQLISQEIVSENNINEIEKKYNESDLLKDTGILKIVGVKKGEHYVLRPKISFAFTLKKQNINTEVAIAHDQEISYPVVIGRYDLKNFLIDPSILLTK